MTINISDFYLNSLWYLKNLYIKIYKCTIKYLSHEI